MVSPVHTLGPEGNLAEVSELMETRRIRHVPIVGPGGGLVGLVTHRDLLARAFGGGEDLPRSIRRPYLESMPVTDIMVGPVQTVPPKADLSEAACQMLARRHGCLLIVQNGRLVGILTSSDFVRYVAGC
jgi:CBS domain-containing membrane protein